MTRQKDKIYKNLFLINFIHLHCEVLSKRKHNYRGNSEGIYSITFLERARSSKRKRSIVINLRSKFNSMIFLEVKQNKSEKRKKSSQRIIVYFSMYLSIFLLIS